VREVSTTRGTYYTPDEIVKAFGLKTALAAPVGVAPHQPSPYEGLTRAIWKRFGLFTLIALGLQLMFALFTTKVHEEIFSVDPGRESAVTSKPFKIDGSGALNLVTYTDLDNTWAGIGFELVDPKSGKVWKQASEMGFYSGIDEDGDRWSEGSARDYVVFTGVPAGEYLLSIEAELPKDAKRALHGRVVVERGHASWLNWILIQIVLLLMPLFAWWRSNAFETERWMNSDHPRGGGDDDDD
jgi:hypothetical protein